MSGSYVPRYHAPANSDGNIALCKPNAEPFTSNVLVSREAFVAMHADDQRDRDPRIKGWGATCCKACLKKLLE